MKLDRLTSMAVAAAAVALACGCSTTPAPRTALLGVRASQGAADDLRPAVDPDIAGTTNLMSARLAEPAPRVGKARLAVDDESETIDLDGNARKETRRSDGSRRGGGFGSTK